MNGRRHTALATLSLALLASIGLLPLTSFAQFFPEEEPTNDQITFGCDPGPIEEFTHEDPPLPPARALPNVPPVPVTLTVSTGAAGRVIDGSGFNLEHALWSCRPFRRILGRWILEPFAPSVARVDSGQLPLAPEGIPAEQLTWTTYQSLMSDPKYQPSWEMLRRLNRDDVRIMLGVWGAPGAFTDDGTRRGRLLHEYIDDYVEYYTAVVDYLVAKQSIKIWSATVMNEPDGGDGTLIDPDDFVTVARKLGPRLAAYGVGLYGPDTASAGNGLPYLDRLLAAPDALNYFNVIGTHEYFDQHQLSEFVERSRSTGKSLPVYVTEYTSFRFGALDRGQETSFEVGHMLDSLSTYVSLMNAGADAALYWDAVDYYQAGHAAITRWGILSGPQDGFEPRKRYYGFQQILPFAQPESRVVQTELSSEHPAAALALLNRDESVEDILIALVNQGTDINLSLAFDGPAPSTLDVYVTDEDRNYERLGRVRLREGRADLYVPAQSVTTLTTGPAPVEDDD